MLPHAPIVPTTTTLIYCTEGSHPIGCFSLHESTRGAWLIVPVHNSSTYSNPCAITHQLLNVT